MNNKNTLTRIRRSLIPTAIGLMERSEHFELVHEGAVMYLRVENFTKATVSWFSQHGKGAELFATLTKTQKREPALCELYVVARVRNPFMRLWRKHTLGGKYYLKLVEPGFNENMGIYMSETLRQFKHREIQI